MYPAIVKAELRSWLIGRHQTSDNPASVCYLNFLAASHQLEQPRQIGLGLVYAN
jgi:hypothetical protein